MKLTREKTSNFIWLLIVIGMAIGWRNTLVTDAERAAKLRAENARLEAELKKVRVELSQR